MHRGTARLIIGSLAGSLALAACGGSSTHTAGAGASTAPTAPTVTTTTTTRTAATKPSTLTSAIDLSGTPGVTPAEQQRAENLIKTTIVDIKRFETPAEAYAAGYRSIGDGITGDEHYVNWSYSNDGHILDPMRPESVVYENVNGAQRAVAAMYALPFGSRFTDAPDVGGALTQWHVHANLCLSDNSQQRVVAGLTSIGGACPPGSAKLGNTPMLHVWVVPNPCGPFAALEGVGAGQVPAGQTRQCSTKYASVP
ncbi:MAG TPA: hypothetical protein VIK54_00970 [Acidimicrobiia bacterium]